MKVRLASCLSLVVLAACASGNRPPETVTRVTGPAGDFGISELRSVPGSSSLTLPARAEDIWAVLPRVYEELGVPEAGAGQGELIYGSMDFVARRLDGKRLSTFIDCGMGRTAIPRADEYRVNMALLTKLTPSAEGTLTETRVQASARPTDVSGNLVPCQSNGTLEKRVTKLITLALASNR